MTRMVALPDSEAPVKIVFDPETRNSLESYLAFCRANPELRVERTAEGEIILVPPAGFESSHRSGEVTAQLFAWARQNKNGTACDSSAGFLLPDGTALSPDAAWVSKLALQGLTRAQRREFLPLAPEFVVEVLSPTDRVKEAQAKMELWIANGVQLAWLIDGDKETVYVYRKDRAPETRRGISELAGDGPVQGFILNLVPVWEGV